MEIGGLNLKEEAGVIVREGNGKFKKKYVILFEGGERVSTRAETAKINAELFTTLRVRRTFGELVKRKAVEAGVTTDVMIERITGF